MWEGVIIADKKIILDTLVLQTCPPKMHDNDSGVAIRDILHLYICASGAWLKVAALIELYKAMGSSRHVYIPNDLSERILLLRIP